MTKSELLKRLEYFPDDCEIKIKNNEKLYDLIEIGWKCDKNISIECDWSNKINEEIINSKKKSKIYILTF